jgi:hypothetical protein
MKTPRFWIYGALAMFALVMWAWVSNARSKADRLDAAEQKAAAAYERMEVEMTREREEFESMDADQRAEYLRQTHLESMRRRVTEARTPGETAAAQAEYERALNQR